MSSLTRKIEVAANIAIITVALLILFVFVKQYFLTRPSTLQGEVTVGTTISLPDIDWAKNERTLLVVLQKGCHYCSESAPFYQRLTQEIEKGRRVHLVAVLPQEVQEGKQYLNELGVSINDVKQADFRSLGVRGTPSLILTDNTGVVKKYWLGKLSLDEESQMLNWLQASP